MTEIDSMKVSSTVIVISKDKKALIVQRPPDKTFPNLWTVAGGKIQSEDGYRITKNFMYYSAEYAAIRELYEETGIAIDINELKYLCSVYAGAINRLILSYYVLADFNSQNVKIKLTECQDYKWITADEVKDYDFIPDISGEIEKVFRELSREVSII